MALLYRRKITVVLLLFYWPVLSVLAHIPIPQLVRRAGVSDKSLHFLAYLVLVFLLWFAVSSDKKVNWRRGAAWLILLVVALYGAVDELSQPLAGRTCDMMDLVANLVGALVGLIVCSIFTFWPAALLVAGTVIFGITNIARANLAELLPTSNAMFHVFGYAVFTMLWIQHMNGFLWVRAPNIRWLVSALAVPILFLLAVKLCSAVLGRAFAASDVLISLGGIAGMVATICLTALFHKTRNTKDRVQV